MARLVAAAPGHVEEVRSLLLDPLSREQQKALRDISDTLAARLSDAPLWPAAADAEEPDPRH
jgi:hypothetical protein